MAIADQPSRGGSNLWAHTARDRLSGERVRRQKSANPQILAETSDKTGTKFREVHTDPLPEMRCATRSSQRDRGPSLALVL